MHGVRHEIRLRRRAVGFFAAECSHEAIAQTFEEVGALSKFFPGWGYQEIWEMTDAERLYWLRWAERYVEEEKKALKGKK